MRILEDFNVSEETDDYITLEMSFGDENRGCIRNKFPKRYDSAKKQNAINKAAELLYIAGERAKQKKEENSI